MAEGPDFAKLKDQVTCPVCLDVFKQPKLLACTHAFCMDCIDQLPVDLVDGENKIQCPICREPTTLPRRGSGASLRPAFLINTLIELHHTAVKLPVAVTDKPKDSKCLKHDRPLEMYCDDCKQVVCPKCFSDGHRTHKCDYISDMFSKCRKEIDNRLQPVKQQLSLVLDALHDLDTQQEHIATHAESVKNQIDALIDQLVQTIRQSGATLKQNVDTLAQHKLNNILQRKAEGEKFFNLLKSCEQYVQDKLRNGSQQEILLENNEMMERLRAVSQQLTLQQLQLKEKADIVFQQSHDILEKCSKTGEVSISTNNPPVKLTSSTVAVVGRPSSIHVVIKVPNVDWVKWPWHNSLSCHLVADAGGVSAQQCKIKHVEKQKYRISFTATHQGLHHVKVQVKGTDIPCDPCTVHVAATIKAKRPLAIATTTSGQLVVAGDTGITLMDAHGHVIRYSDSRGGGSNTGVCVTPDDEVVVLSNQNPHMTRYTMDFSHGITTKTSHGNGPLQFNCPQGIAVSTGGDVYICDTENHRIKVRKSDGLVCHFGRKGNGPGQFFGPRGIAVDTHQGTLYVIDGSLRVQKFLSHGIYMYISEFEVSSRPLHIAIDPKDSALYITTHDTIVVYTTDGDILYKGQLSDGQCSYGGVAVNEKHFYMCDHDNDQVIVF